MFRMLFTAQCNWPLSYWSRTCCQNIYVTRLLLKYIIIRTWLPTNASETPHHAIHLQLAIEVSKPFICTSYKSWPIDITLKIKSYLWHERRCRWHCWCFWAVWKPNSAEVGCIFEWPGGWTNQPTWYVGSKVQDPLGPFKFSYFSPYKNNLWLWNPTCSLTKPFASPHHSPPLPQTVYSYSFPHSGLPSPQWNTTCGKWCLRDLGSFT